MQGFEEVLEVWDLLKIGQSDWQSVSSYPTKLSQIN
jgi:hypothetical protein